MAQRGGVWSAFFLAAVLWSGASFGQVCTPDFSLQISRKDAEAMFRVCTEQLKHMKGLHKASLQDGKRFHARCKLYFVAGDHRGVWGSCSYAMGVYERLYSPELRSDAEEAAFMFADAMLRLGFEPQIELTIERAERLGFISERLIVAHIQGLIALKRFPIAKRRAEEGLRRFPDSLLLKAMMAKLNKS